MGRQAEPKAGLVGRMHKVILDHFQDELQYDSSHTRKRKRKEKEKGRERKIYRVMKENKRKKEMIKEK